MKPGAADEAYRDLTWLGLDWDAGPRASLPPQNAREDAGESAIPSPDPYVQSQRLDLYAAALDALRRRGLAYPCVCTRKELESVLSAPNAGEDLHERRYPGVCRDRFVDAEAARRASGREPGWRFRVEEGATTAFVDGFQGRQESVLAAWSGDFLIARGDVAGYQLAVVLDDHEMGVSEVVRGDDLLPSTHRQLALYRALGWTPPRFFHMPLVTGPDGRRLAKRHGDTRLSLLRNGGRGPERLLGWLAWSCGWLETRRETTLAEIAAACDFGAIPREKAVLTGEDARWIGFPG